MQFCGEPGCGVLVASGRCPVHTRTERTTRPPHDRWYRTKPWGRLRLDVLREQPFCVACRAEGRHTVATEIDHIRPHRGDRQWFWNRQNLQGLCASHHSAKSARGE